MGIRRLSLLSDLFTEGTVNKGPAGRYGAGLVARTGEASMADGGPGRRRGRRPKELDAALPAHRRQFAERLRRLRAECGDPPYRILSRLSHCSVGTLSTMTGGRRFPDWAATRAFVTGCLRHAGRVDEVAARLPEWRRWWRAAHLREQVGRAAGVPSSADPVWPRPAQLPADVSGFTGRAGELATLDGILSAGGGSTPVTVAIVGCPGVGKTALAVRWAHSVADRFPDGQVYLNLRGFGPEPPVPPATAVRDVLTALGAAPGWIPATMDAQIGLYRSLVAGRRILVVLDNARDADQVRPLLPGTAGAVTVVTSRNQLRSLMALDGVRPVVLGALPAVSARDLLAERIGPERVAAEPAATEAVIAACAGLPLALAIAAARSRRTGFPLGAIAAEVAAPGRRLDALDGGDPAGELRAVFSWSYDTLPPPAARLFRLLGLHPGPDITAYGAASLAGVGIDAARAALGELDRASLVGEHRPGRYAGHDLLAAYAADLAATHETGDARDRATLRLLSHYARSAAAAVDLVDPHRDPVEPAVAAPVPGVRAEAPADARAAGAWLGAEHPVMRALADLAAARGLDGYARHLTRVVDAYGYVGHLAAGRPPARAERPGTRPATR
jgi:hypothetical protein